MRASGPRRDVPCEGKVRHLEEISLVVPCSGGQRRAPPDLDTISTGSNAQFAFIVALQDGRQPERPGRGEERLSAIILLDVLFGLTSSVLLVASSSASPIRARVGERRLPSCGDTGDFPGVTAANRPLTRWIHLGEFTALKVHHAPREASLSTYPAAHLMRVHLH